MNSEPRVKKFCRICGDPVIPIKRNDRKGFRYPRQCSNCFKISRDEPARRKHISEALEGLKHPKSRPIGSRRLHKTVDSTYYLIKVGPKRNDWMFEHRYIISNLLQRNLSPNEHVHHLNGNPLDNRKENLRLLPRNIHMNLHNIISGWAKHYDCCKSCGETSRKHSAKGYCTRCYQRHH